MSPFEASREVDVFHYSETAERVWCFSYAGGANLGPRDCDGYRISSIGGVRLLRRDEDWCLGQYAFESGPDHPGLFEWEVR